jgi:hypothetical protein
VGLYQTEYTTQALKAWQPSCADGVGVTAFLPQRTVNSESALMTQDTDQVTMACRTGAIATCMVWGYKPWKAAPGEESRADFMYGSCLQAKRAAYFVQSGDFNSYTRPGTPIAVQDKAGIMYTSMPGVEALWNPEGAVCFSPEFRRVPPDLMVPTLPADVSRPACNARLHQLAHDGQLLEALGDSAPLATGRQFP